MAGVHAPGTVIELSKDLLPLLVPRDNEVGGVLLFDRSDGHTLRLNTITGSLGDNLGVNPNGLIKTFGLHPSWFIYHTHPPPAIERYMGLSGPDLAWMLLLSLSSNQEHSIVTHLLSTHLDIHITHLNPDVYSIFLRLYNGFITDLNVQRHIQVPPHFVGNDGVRTFKQAIFLEFYSLLFKLVEATFNIEHNRYPHTPKYSRDTHALTILDNLSFIPQEARSWELLMSMWAAADVVLGGRHDGAAIFARIRSPEMAFIHAWINNRGADGAGGVALGDISQQNIVGLFKTTSFRKGTDQIHEAGEYNRFVCGDGGYIYNNTVPWDQAGAIPPVVGQIVPMIMAEEEPPARGAGRKNIRKNTRKHKHKRGTRGTRGIKT